MSGWRWAPLTGGWRVGAESETARVRGDITRSHELRHFVVKMSADSDLYNNANIIFLPRSVRLFYNIPSAFFSFCVIKLKANDNGRLKKIFKNLKISTLFLICGSSRIRPRWRHRVLFNVKCLVVLNILNFLSNKSYLILSYLGLHFPKRS